MRKIAVLDLETDPFEYGHVPEPFLSGFYDGQKFVTVWDEKECINRTVRNLNAESEPLVIYAHNGGKFDFFYFLDHIKADLQIVGSRIIKANLGEHELRDSFAIMPFALAKLTDAGGTNKLELDYQKLSKSRRNNHRDEIIEYLRADCVALYERVVRYIQEFGDVLTVGSASMKQLKTFHKFSCGGPQFDAKFRKPFYFGGRNQVFKSGIVKLACNVYDVNSEYPYVMSAFLHPIGTGAEVSNRIETNTVFVVAEGRNYGAFPTRTKKGLDFTIERGTFSTTIHEWEAALETGSFEPTKIIKTYGFESRSNFSGFVSHFFTERIAARKAGDEILAIFYKFVLNSSYGKFAQNPANYFEWQIAPYAADPLPIPWEPAAIAQNKYILWRKPVERLRFFNVATGASITGAARSVLLRGLCAATKPIYCDTDSIICESLNLPNIDDTTLGSWKLEASGSMAAIAGKKLYAIFDSQGTCIKKAHKGVPKNSISGEEIARIARGEMISVSNPVPAYRPDGTHLFITRQLRRTSHA